MRVTKELCAMSAKVAIKSISENMLKTAEDAARMCYNSKSKNKKCDINFLIDRLKTGHLTIFQHGNITFKLSNISRYIVSEFFHHHRFYNTSQLSQRYVKVNESQFYIPCWLNEEQKLLYKNIANKMYHLYEEMTIKIQNDMASHIKDSQKKRKAQEAARYILPIGTYTEMYHTIDMATLLKYTQEAKVTNSHELKDIIEKMNIEVCKIYPEWNNIILSLDAPTNETLLTLKAGNFSLEKTKVSSKVIQSEDRPCDLCVNIKKINQVVSSPLSMYDIDDTISSFNAYNIKTIKTMSHAAHSQNQRHRTSKIHIQKMDMMLTRATLKYINPIDLMQGVSQDVQNYFDECMQSIYEDLANFCRHADIHAATYLLPNAIAVDVSENTGFGDYIFKMKNRLCFCAQDEIREISNIESKKINQFVTFSNKILLPPCASRSIAELNIICPENNEDCLRFKKLVPPRSNVS